MSSFYGNIKSGNKMSIVFDKIYSNRKEMDESCTSDGIFNGRYVLINYGERKFIDYARVYPTEEIFNAKKDDYYVIVFDIKNGVLTQEVTRCNNNSKFNEKTRYYIKQKAIFDEEIYPNLFSDPAYEKAKEQLVCDFVKNRNIDEYTYNDVFDHTIWQKIWTQTGDTNTVVEKYILVGRLDAKAPTMELIVDSPQESENDASTYERIPSDKNDGGYITEKQFKHICDYYEVVEENNAQVSNIFKTTDTYTYTSPEKYDKNTRYYYKNDDHQYVLVQPWANDLPFENGQISEQLFNRLVKNDQIFEYKLNEYISAVDALQYDEDELYYKQENEDYTPIVSKDIERKFTKEDYSEDKKYATIFNGNYIKVDDYADNIEYFELEEQSSKSDDSYIYDETIKQYRPLKDEDDVTELTLYKISPIKLYCKDGHISYDEFKNYKEQGNLYLQFSGYYVAAKYNPDTIYYYKTNMGIGPHFDSLRSDELNYVLHIPKNWKFKKESTLNINEEGLKPERRSKIEGAKNEILVETDLSTQSLYPKHRPDLPTAAIYEGYNKVALAEAPDTKKFNFKLPEIGNIFSDIWDMIYPLKYEEDKEGKYYKDKYGLYQEVPETIPEGQEDKYLPRYSKSDIIRDLTIGNPRDEQMSADGFMPLAELIKYVYMLLGQPTDNELFDKDPYGSVYSLLNGARFLFGGDNDTLYGTYSKVPLPGLVSDKKYVSAADGKLAKQEKIFDCLKAQSNLYFRTIKDDKSYGPLTKVEQENLLLYSNIYYMDLEPTCMRIPSDRINDNDKELKTIDDKTGYISKELFDKLQAKNHTLYVVKLYSEDGVNKYGFQKVTSADKYSKYERYYTDDLLSIFAYLNDLQDKYPMYQSDWELTSEKAFGYINNKPDVVISEPLSLQNEINTIDSAISIQREAINDAILQVVQSSESLELSCQAISELEEKYNDFALNFDNETKALLNRQELLDIINELKEKIPSDITFQNALEAYRAAERAHANGEMSDAEWETAENTWIEFLQEWTNKSESEQVVEGEDPDDTILNEDDSIVTPAEGTDSNEADSDEQDSDSDDSEYWIRLSKAIEEVSDNLDNYDANYAKLEAIRDDLDSNQNELKKITEETYDHTISIMDIWTNYCDDSKKPVWDKTYDILIKQHNDAKNNQSTITEQT